MGAEAAPEIGLATLHGDAIHNAALDAAGVTRARALIVSPSRDDTAIPITLTARRLAPEVCVTVSIREAENEVLARATGTAVIVNPSASQANSSLASASAASCGR